MERDLLTGRRQEDGFLPVHFSFIPLWSSESQSSPTVFPLVSCESPLSDENLVAMGCLARDFLPSTISFSWIYQNNTEVKQGVRTFPTLRSGEKYTATSQVLLSAKNVLESSDEYLLCKIRHGSKNRDLHVPIPGKNQPLPAGGGGGTGTGVVQRDQWGRA